MAGFIAYVLIFLIVGLGIGYLIATKMLGHEAATRNIRYVLPYMAVGAAFGLMLTQLDGVYSQLAFPLIYVVGVSVWLLSWPSRHRDSGGLLLRAGRNSQSKLSFWIGVFEAIVSAVLSLELFLVPISSFEDVSSEIALVATFLAISVFFISIGLSKLELRENGLCFMFMFIAWSQMTSYKWEPSNPNTLTLKYKPRFPLMPGFMSIKVPPRHRADVDRIVQMQVNPSV